MCACSLIETYDSESRLCFYVRPLFVIYSIIAIIIIIIQYRSGILSSDWFIFYKNSSNDSLSQRTWGFLHHAWKWTETFDDWGSLQCQCSQERGATLSSSVQQLKCVTVLSGLSALSLRLTGSSPSTECAFINPVNLQQARRGNGTVRHKRKRKKDEKRVLV